MRKISVYIIFTLVLSHSLRGQEKLELLDVISIGLENNFDIRIAEKDIDIARNNIDPGNAGMLPTVGINASQNYQYQNLDGIQASGNEIQIEGARPVSGNIGANLQWTVFDGLGMFYNYRNLGELSNLSKLESRLIMEEAVSNIILAFYDVYVESQRLKALETTLEISEERKKLAETSYEVGRASKLEMQQAQVDFNADRSAYIQQQEVLYSAKVSLNLLLARDPKTDFEVEEKFEINNELMIQELEESALVKNTNLQIINSNQKLTYNEQLMINAERWPVLNLIGGGSVGRSENPAGFFVVTNTSGYNYGLSLNWNVFNGFDINRRNQNIKIRNEQLNIERDKIRYQILADLLTFFSRYNNNALLVELEEQNLEVATDNAEIALERYKVGKSNPLELREAQVNALQAEIRLIEARQNLKTAEVNLLRISGKLLD